MKAVVALPILLWSGYATPGPPFSLDLLALLFFSLSFLFLSFRVGSGREEVQSATPALVPRQLVLFFPFT